MRLQQLDKASVVPLSAIWIHAGCFVLSVAVIALAGFAFVTSQERVGQIERFAAAQTGADEANDNASAAAAAPVQKLPGRHAVVIARVGAVAGAGSPDVPGSSAGLDNASPIAADSDPDARTEPWVPQQGTWRTVCVRLCDGAMTPMSFATTRNRFQADARRCERGCSSPARLFAMRPDAEPETLVDLKGHKYSDLPTAFLFRTSFEPSCTCRGPGGRDRTTVAGLAADLPASSSMGSTPESTQRVADPGRAVVDVGGVEVAVVQAALAIAAAAPQPAIGRDPLRPVRDPAGSGEGVSVVGTVPMQGQGSVAQAHLTRTPDATGRAAAIAANVEALPAAEPNIVTLAPGSRTAAKRSRKNVAALSRKRGRTGVATVVTSRSVASLRKVARAGAQRSFSSPDYWRVSYWQPY